MQNLNLDFFFPCFQLLMSKMFVSQQYRKPSFFISQLVNNICRVFLMYRLVICLIMHDLQLKEIVLKMYRKHMYTHGVSFSIGTHTPCLYMNAHMCVYIYICISFFFCASMHPFLCMRANNICKMCYAVFFID